MTTLKRSLLVGACAIGAMTVVAGTANAGTVKVYGGGSSLISVYMQQAFNCYGQINPLIIRTPLQLETLNNFNYVGTKGTPQDCSSQHVQGTASLHYDTAGSGVGIAGVFSHDPSSDFPNGYGDIDPNTPGEQDMPSISFGMSDAGLSSSDVGVWNLGNDNNGPTNACSTPEQGVCVVAPGETPNPPTTFANPLQTRGALVQFPISVDPVAFVYYPTYKKVDDGAGHVTSYNFNIKFAHSDGSGGLRLDRNAYCVIFNGYREGNPITNWNDSRLKTLNGNKSLADPSDPDKASFSVPLQIAGRSDSSGTTSIFTRHLAAVCGVNGINDPNNDYTTGATTLPVDLRGGTFDGTTATNVVLGKFTLANGSGNLAKYVAFTANPSSGGTLVQGNIAYIGADFALPASIVNGNGLGLNSADLKNSSGKFEAATGANAATAFGSLAPPESDAHGHYQALGTCPGSGRCRAHPYDWVEGLAPTSVLADPSSAKAYPVVGTTNVLLYTCYANSKISDLIKKYFTWYVKNTTVQEIPDGLLVKNGLSSLPTPWRTAITETFLHTNVNTAPLGLEIEASGTGVCTGVTGG